MSDDEMSSKRYFTMNDGLTWIVNALITWPNTTSLGILMTLSKLKLIGHWFSHLFYLRLCFAGFQIYIKASLMNLVIFGG